MAWCLSACNAAKEDSGKPLVVTTTGIIADCMSEILGDQAEVVSLMGPGVDPHLYKASQGDLELLSKADIIVYNGLHLEGKMTQVFDKLGKTKLTLSLGSFAPVSALKKASPGSDLVDPHIWFSPNIWLTCLEGAVDSLDRLGLFKDLKISYEAYQLSILELKANLVGKLDKELPPERRVLITSHDAFSYFGDAFGFRVRGLQGISTAAEFGVKDVTDLIAFIQANQIRSIFVETSISEKNLKAVVDGAHARGYEVRIGGTLYSDALGSEGSGADTYAGMLEKNIETIINALK